MRTAPPSIEPQGLLEGLHWRAIVLGAIVDNIATLLGFTALLVWFADGDALSGDPEQAERVVQEVVASPEFMLWGLAVGLLGTVFGAFWGARLAGEDFLRHGGWIAVVSVVVGSLPLILGGPGEGTRAAPFWYDAAGLMLMLPAGLFGGWLASLSGDGEEG